MVVAGFRARLPFVNFAPSARGADAVLGGEVFGKSPVQPCIAAEQREAPAVAHAHAKPRLQKALPEVRVVKGVADRAAAGRSWNPPVVADAVAGFARYSANGRLEAPT